MSSRPFFHDTVTAESVDPVPVIWSKLDPVAARALPGGPMAVSVTSAARAASVPDQRTRAMMAALLVVMVTAAPGDFPADPARRAAGDVGSPVQ